MAAGRIVLSSNMPARDRNDRLVSGALLYVYVNGTTTKASIYSDSTLTTPLSNPVVANSSGAFVSIWAEAGTAANPTLYTISLTGPNGESLGNPSVWDDFSPSLDWASDVSAFWRDTLLDETAAAARTSLGTVAATSNGSDFASVGTVLDNLTVTQTSGTARAASSKIKDIFDARDWGCVADGSSQQTKVQEAIDDLASVPYAVLNIPNGVIFNSQTLDFSTNHRIVLRFPRDCDSGAIGPYAGGTGEIITLAVTSEYPTDTSSAYVGEDIFEAPIHASIFADTRSDMTGVSSGLGTGQSLLAPVRSSIGVRQERTDRQAITLIYYGDAKSSFSGVYYRNYRQTYTLQGVGSSAWVSAPAVGDLVTASNGAKGYVTAIDASTLTVEWITGRFASGTTLADSNESGIGPITTATRNTIQEMSPLVQAIHTGHWGINCSPGNASSPWTVGGDMRVRRWQSYGQYTPTDQQTQWPGFVWENPGGGGASARNVSGENTKRVFMYDGTAESASPRGMLGAVCASVAFSDALALATSALNVASITNPAAGNYEITFTRQMASAEYSVQVSMSSLMSRPASGTTFYTIGYEFVAAATLQVRVSLVDLVANTVTATDIPAGAQVSVTVFCGDVA